MHTFANPTGSKTSLVDTGGKTVQVDLWELQPSAGVFDETRFEPSPTLDDLKVDEAIAKQWAASDLEVEGQASEIPEPKSKRKVSKEGKKKKKKKKGKSKKKKKQKSSSPKSKSKRVDASIDDPSANADHNMPLASVQESACLASIQWGCTWRCNVNCGKFYSGRSIVYRHALHNVRVHRSFCLTKSTYNSS
jgi:hypothetical protein